ISLRGYPNSSPKTLLSSYLRGSCLRVRAALRLNHRRCVWRARLLFKVNQHIRWQDGTLDDFEVIWEGRLRQRIKHNNRLVSPRHHRFRDGDQFIFLAEHAQPRRLNFFGIQMGRGARRQLHAARLQLRRHHVEFRAVANLLFQYGQHIGSRKIRQQVLERDQARLEFSILLRLRQFFETDGLLQREFSHRRAADFRQMRAAAQLLSHVVRQRPDVSSRRALNRKSRDRPFYSCQAVFENLHRHRFQLHNLILARQFIRRPPVDFLGGKNRGHLLEAPRGFRRQPLQRFALQHRRRIRSRRLPFRVKRVRGIAKAETGGVALSPPGIKSHKASGFSQQQNQDAGRQWIEGAQMPDLPESRKMPHRIHDVVRSLTLRLVDDQGAVKRGGLWLARHKTLFSDQLFGNKEQDFILSILFSLCK